MDHLDVVGDVPGVVADLDRHVRRTAPQMLFAMINGGPAARKVILPTEIILRGSAPTREV